MGRNKLIESEKILVGSSSMEVHEVTTMDLNIYSSEGKELGREFYYNLYDKLVRMYQEEVRAYSCVPYSFGKGKSKATRRKRTACELELEELEELIFMVKMKLLSLNPEEVVAPKTLIYNYPSDMDLHK